MRKSPKSVSRTFTNFVNATGGIVLWIILLIGIFLLHTKPVNASSVATYTLQESVCMAFVTSEGKVMPLCDEPLRTCERSDDGELRCFTTPGRAILDSLTQQLKGAP